MQLLAPSSRKVLSQMHTRNSGEHGFSLIELTIAMALTMILVAASAALLSGSFNIRSREDRRTEAIAAAQHALNAMSRDIANAGFGLKRNGIVNQDSDASSIRIRANLNAFAGVPSSGTLADADEDVEYFLHKTDPDPDATRGDLMRYDVNLQQSRLLVSNVENFEIYYFSQKVDYTLDPSGGIICATPEVDDQSGTKYVVITILLKLDQVGTPGSPGYVPAGQIQLATDVALRNQNLAMF
jgi:type II secretory pathway pseudopilin PulG